MAGNFPGGEGGMIDLFVVSNKAGDDPQRQDGSMRLMNPRTMNPQNVNAEDMLFSGSMINPTQMGQQSSPGRLDPGTLVYGMKIPGQNQVIVLGQAQTQRKSGSGGGGGGGDLMSGFNDLFNDKLPINTPPDIQETTDADGVKIRKIKEKGKEHSFSALDGLPSHGASFPLAGYRHPELPNVPTARQQNTQMLSQDMIQQMAGQIMSFGQLFQGMMGNAGGGGGGGGAGGGTGNLGTNAVAASDAPKNSPLSNVLNSLTPDMKTALSNLTALVQGLEANDGVAFFTGDVVHEETYIKNAEELLSQVTTLDDLMYVLQRLQWDTTLFGQDKLDKVVTQIETAWGIALQEVSHDGEIYVTYLDPNQNTSVNYAQTDLVISTTGVITESKRINNGSNRSEWIGTIEKMTRTLGLTNNDIITAESNTADIGAGSLGANNDYYRVVMVVDDTTIQFKTGGNSAPVLGNIANVTLHTFVPETPIGQVAEAIVQDNMSSAMQSPGVGSSPSGGGSGGGQGGGSGGGGMQNMFGKASGIMQDMFKRLPQSGEKEATKLHQKLNQQKFPQTAADVAKKTKQGQSPLDLFKSMTGGM